MYKLICMSFDGEYVTECDRFNEAFATVNNAWEHSSNMGSKWFFYPFHFIVNGSGKTIMDAPIGLEQFNHKRVKTVSDEFAYYAALPIAQKMDCDEFVMLLNGFIQVRERD